MSQSERTNTQNKTIGKEQVEFWLLEFDNSFSRLIRMLFLYYSRYCGSVDYYFNSFLPRSAAGDTLCHIASFFRFFLIGSNGDYGFYFTLCTLHYATLHYEYTPTHHKLECIHRLKLMIEFSRKIWARECATRCWFIWSICGITYPFKLSQYLAIIFHGFESNNLEFYFLNNDAFKYFAKTLPENFNQALHSPHHCNFKSRIDDINPSKPDVLTYWTINLLTLTILT